MITYIAAIFCVLSLAVGQILFKLSANALHESGSFFAFKTASIFFMAMCVYGFSSLIWVWTLQKVELGRIYPLVALAFVLVPLGSHIIFGEKFNTQYFVGVAMIIMGIVVSVRGHI